jgi:Legume lectin domain
MERRIVSFSRSSRAVRGSLVAAFAISLAATSAPAGAYAADGDTPINYPTFSGASTSLDRNGTADLIVSPDYNKQRILRLTAGGYRQSGSAWDVEQLDLTRSFESIFKVYLHHGAPDADGIAFVLQAEGPRALGGWGGGLGFRGIKRSVAVEFDTFQNPTDPSANHIGLVLGGNPDVHEAVAEASVPLEEKPFQARVQYDATTHQLQVYLKSLRRGATEQLLLDRPVDLTAELGAGSAWVGFTASTGSALSKQDIYSWTVSAAEPTA